MPLTALLDGRDRLDTTLEDLGAVVLSWDDVYRTRPRARLSCTDCGRPMHAKTSNRGARFFAHDRAAPGCLRAGETEEHRSLKRALAAAARAAGCEVEVEATGEGRRWRADVLATTLHGPRTALEAQVSSAPVEEVLERTGRYASDGIDVVWFTPRAARWAHRVPSVHVRRPATPKSPWARTYPVVSHFFSSSCDCDPRPPWHGPVHTGWSRAEEMDLLECVIAVLHGSLVPRELEQADARADLRYGGWTTPEDIEASAEDALSRKHAAARAREAATPWYRRWTDEEQQRLLDAATDWVRRTLGATATARPGWTADWVAGGLALSRPHGGSLTRAALIRPDPARIDWTLIRGLTVIVGSQQEHADLTRTAPPEARIIVLDRQTM